MIIISKKAFFFNLNNIYTAKSNTVALVIGHW